MNRDIIENYDPRFWRFVEKLEKLIDAKHLFPEEKMLCEKEVARKLGVSLSYMQHDRQQGDGIPYVKIGRSVRYSPEAVLEYLTKNVRRHTSDQGGQR